jgi:hypothetical protein
MSWWDFKSASGTIVVVGGLSAAVFVLGLPGRIAIARKHPGADAINVMGWLGVLAVVPWMQALSGTLPAASAQAQTAPDGVLVRGG